MIKNISLNGVSVVYHLQYKSVKNINLRIKHDGSVFVSANHTISEKSIEDFLSSKAQYILKALDYYNELARYAPKPKMYVDGETFKVLGRELRLKVFPNRKNAVSSDEAYIYLYVKDVNDYTAKKKLMDRWLSKICEDTIKSLCVEIFTKFQKYGVEFPDIRFRYMTSRWGSCQPKRKRLTFNYALLELPVSCIEYVVIHEFTHFLQPNHSQKFYRQLFMFMPDWEKRKELLEKEGRYAI